MRLTTLGLGVFGLCAYAVLLSEARKGPAAIKNSWTDRVLEANGLSRRRLGERGIVYLAVGPGAVAKAFRSGRSARRWNSKSVGILLVTDSIGKGSVSAWNVPLFDVVIDVGKSSGKMKYEDMEEYEGFRAKSPNSRRRTAASAKKSARRQQLSTRAFSLKRLRILKVRTLMMGLRLYETIIFLDTDTAACAPFDSLFRNSDADVSFVKIPGSTPHNNDLLQETYKVPENFPEANTGVLVIKNSSKAQGLLTKWNAAYHSLAQSEGNLMDQPAFRVALYTSDVTFAALEREYNCRGRDRKTKKALPLACGGLLPEDSECAVLHSHDLTPDNAEGPFGLPNFYLLPEGDERRSAYKTAPAIFLHIPKAAGNSVKQLFVKQVLLEQRSKQQGQNQQQGKLEQSLHIDTRRAWDQRPSKDALVMYGAFSFGACANHPIGKPCAHYVIFRDPVARIVSEFNYCNSKEVDFGDQCCTGRRGSGGMRGISTVAEWAEERGNFMLEHLIHLSPLDWAVREDDEDDWHRRDRDKKINPIETRRLREGPANAANLALALANLDNWFAIVGITERYSESLALFSYALTGTVMPSRVAMSVHTHNQNSASGGKNSTTLGNALDATTRDRIERAVEFDRRLYNAANALFDRQIAAFKAAGLDFV